MPDESARRHPATVQLLRWFDYDHLRPGVPRDVSKLHHDLAHQLVGALPDGPELSAGLRKLLEAKDCHVRAAIDAVTSRPALRPAPADWVAEQQGEVDRGRC